MGSGWGWMGSGWEVDRFRVRGGWFRVGVDELSTGTEAASSGCPEDQQRVRGVMS